MNMIKTIVSQLTSKYRTNDPFEISAQRNIMVLFEDLGEILGYYNTFKRIHMIHLNKDIDDSIRNFVCSHELGHAVLHPKLNTPFMKKHTLFSTDKIEREANQFAMELLMPDEDLYEDHSHSTVTIKEAAAIYGVPEKLAHLKKI